MVRFLNAPYVVPMCQSSGCSTEAKLPVAPSKFQTETTILVNKGLAEEVAEWKEKHDKLLQDRHKRLRNVSNY